MAVKSTLDRIFVLELVRVTEAAAIAAAKLVGKGDEKAADAAAVDSMRNELNNLAIKGRIVIGEGERDEAPMLYIGEEVGTGEGPEIDIALDPLEGTTIAAKAMQNALAVVALAEKGNLLNAPDVYMDKIAVGPGLADGIVDLDKSVDENIIKTNEAIILSMTKEERLNPKIINTSRKKRISGGSGTDSATVNKLLKQFKTMTNMMKKMSKGDSENGIPPEIFEQLK